MKVTVNEKSNSDKREYPWIGISNTESIVLFTKKK